MQAPRVPRKRGDVACWLLVGAVVGFLACAGMSPLNLNRRRTGFLAWRGDVATLLADESWKNLFPPGHAGMSRSSASRSSCPAGFPV